jgi:hypothetical protein
MLNFTYFHIELKVVALLQRKVQIYCLAGSQTSFEDPCIAGTLDQQHPSTFYSECPEA